MIEVVVAAAMILIVVGGLTGAAYLSLRLSALSNKTSEANNLAQETMEAFRNFRDGTSWAAGVGALGTGAGNPWHLAKSFAAPYNWNVLAGEEVAGEFTRKLILENVSRDPATGRIEAVYNGAHNDSETKKATVFVFWGEGKQTQLTAYFTNWK